jgi:hypothetical protein
MYYGERETRVLLSALFRDLYRYPIVMQIREQNGWSRDVDLIAKEFSRQLATTRFLGLGNPAESGTHLLYFFRQQNSLPKDLFVHTHQLFDRRLDDADVHLSDPTITRLVFLDDFCGTGQQAVEYSTKVLPIIRDVEAREGLNLEASYFALFGTTQGIDRVKASAGFDRVGTVAELDETYKAFGEDSRYFMVPTMGIDRDFAEAMARFYGGLLLPGHPLGYQDSQLMLGFRHNVPDNTLPLFWSGPVKDLDWSPVFRRFHKIYG